MVVFFDIDGTIVDEETQSIPESTVRAVEKLKEKGHIAVVNTGRPLSHIDPRVRAMAFSGWVCGCGMEVFLQGKWIYRNHPSPELCRYVRDSIRELGMQVFLLTDSLLNRAGADISQYPHGSFGELMTFIREL